MKIVKFVIASVLTVWLISGLSAQTTNFEVQLEPVEINGLGGVQSYALGRHEGKWLIVGGRLDGLHRRQPFAGFDVAGHNTDLIVIDPVQKKQWRRSNASLPAPVREQLSATNPEFHQEGDMLYFIGGYGFSYIADNHVTYPNLCAIDVPGVIDAIINNKDITPFFRQIKDDKLAVTGGYLHKVYNTYYLVGGQKFIGRYNPMGPTHGPGFVQEYTNAIRKFKLHDNGVQISIQHLEEITDENNLHRRDYNVAQQIFPDGTFGLTAFSGVFQKDADLPFLNCVNIDSSGYSVQPDFNQYYNHYHCAHFPLYSGNNMEMHTLFFGGIAQYFDDNGVLTKDDNVPFVNTIARVTRTKDGKMAEYKLKSTMPGLLGSGAEFVTVDNIPTFANGVINLDEIDKDTTHIGYIYGGISSSAPNIFFTNTGNESSAHPRIYKVNLIQGKSTAVNGVNIQSQNGLGMLVYPNPGHENISINFVLQHPSEVTLSLYDVKGAKIKDYSIGMQLAGTHYFDVTDIPENHNVLIFRLQAGDKVSVQKLILN